MLSCLAFLLGGALAQFVIPPLPISKANASFPNCRTEIIFVLDVSGSVYRPDQQTMMRFTTQVMVAVERNVKDARFGAVVFGINAADTNQSRKSFDMTPFGSNTTLVFNGPLGNRKTVGSETILGLDHLRYNCTECAAVNSSFSQLQYMWTIGYDGGLTPTWDGLDMATDTFTTQGDPTVDGRFVVLITDGVPNDSNCYPPNFNSSSCITSINATDMAVARATRGTLLFTVGMNLNNDTQPLMVRWASSPKEIMAIPSTDYSLLTSLIPKFLNVMCLSGSALDCPPAGGVVEIRGQFLNTAMLACRFFPDGQQPTLAPVQAAVYVNSTVIKCPLPANITSGIWVVQFTVDGRGYYEGAKFKFGTACANTTNTSNTTNTVNETNTTNNAFCNSLSALLLFSLSLFLW